MVWANYTENQIIVKILKRRHNRKDSFYDSDTTEDFTFEWEGGQ